MPKITFQPELERVAKDIVIPEIIGGINKGKAVDGGSFPELDAKTVQRKGHNRPLIDTGTLRKSLIHNLVGKDKVKITISGDRKKIGGYLQITGINGKFFNFFGISTKMEKLARLLMERVINNAVDKAKRK